MEHLNGDFRLRWRLVDTRAVDEDPRHSANLGALGLKHRARHGAKIWRADTDGTSVKRPGAGSDCRQWLDQT